MVDERSDGEFVVSTTAGQVRGRPWRDGAAFLGVPYAEPPFGDLRFLAPVPPTPWQGVRAATEYGPTPQRQAFAEITAIPEPSIPGDDVLSVNVFTPGADASGLPVLVYIHGGGYVAGSPASPWYDGAAFNRDGVVVVTISYRVAFEGFGWIPDAPNNRGVLDWILALEWVRDNIAAFGGDPARVTIAGQSAGGGAVLTLLTTPAAQGLFSAVASISGAPSDISPDAAEVSARALAKRLGVSCDRAGFASVPEADFVAAQGIAIELPESPTAASVLGAITGLVAGRRSGPIIDGTLLPLTVEDGIRAGVGSELPLLLGATRDEFTVIATSAGGLLSDSSAEELLIATGVDPDVAAAYVAAAPDLEPAEVLGASVTDRIFRQVVSRIARLRTGGANTWVYDFAWASGVSGRAEHCLDVPFVFDVLADPAVARLAGDEAPQALADTVHGAYAAFATDHDPGWPPSTGLGPVMMWDAESTVDDGAAYGPATVFDSTARG